MYLKPKTLTLLLTAFLYSFGFYSCTKEDDELRKRIEQLESKVASMESRLDQIGANLVELEEQGKLNAEETKALQALTNDLVNLTNDLKAKDISQAKEITGIAERISELRNSLQHAVTVVQFEALNKTVAQLSALINQQGLDQKLTAKNVEELNKLIEAMSSDLEVLKADPSGANLDRPTNLTASQGRFNTQIVVSWTSTIAAKNYQLFRFNDIKGDYEKIYEGADTLYTDTATFTPYQNVFYKVKVSNSFSSFSNFSDVAIGFTSGSKYNRYLFFGYEGRQPGTLGLVLYMNVDQEDNIYLSDDYNAWLQKFDKSGNFKEIFFRGNSPRGTAFLSDGTMVVTNTQVSNYVKLVDREKKILKQWGTPGTGNGQFGNIEEVTVDNDDNIYIVDGIANSIKKFDSNGQFLLKFTGAVQAPGQVENPYPRGICFLNNKIFVSSPQNGLIRVFDKSGNLLDTWDTGVAYCSTIKAFKNNLYITGVDYVLKTDESGRVLERIGEKDLTGSYLSGIAINSKGDVIVSATYNRKIHIYKEL